MAAAVVIVLAAFALSGPSAGPAKSTSEGTAVQTSGTAAHGSKATVASSENNPAISRCVELCRSLIQQNVDLSTDFCISSNVRGYGCAITHGGASPCKSRTSYPQILLDANCNYLRIVPPRG